MLIVPCVVVESNTAMSVLVGGAGELAVLGVQLAAVSQVELEEDAYV